MKKQERKSEFAGLRAKYYALGIAPNAEEMKKLNVHTESFSEPTSYTRSIYGDQNTILWSGASLITNITRVVNGIYVSIVKDNTSGIVCEEIKKGKGMKEGIVTKGLTLEDFKVLFAANPQYRKMNMIRSDKHDVYTITVNKKTLSAIDDKRVIMSDRISTMAIGHYITLA